MNSLVSVAFHQRRRFSKWIQFGLPLLGLTLLWLLYHEVQLLFTSLMIAWGLYYVLNPVVDAFEARSINRAAGSAVVLIGLIMVMYMIWLRFVNFGADLRNKIDLDIFQKNLVGTAHQLIVAAETKVPTLKRFIEPDPVPENQTPGVQSPGKSRSIFLKPLTPPVFRKPLKERLEDFIKKEVVERAPTFAIKIATLIPNLAANLVLIPYFTFFFLKDGRFFKKTMIEWIPNRYFEPALKFFYEMDCRMRSYLQSLLLDCMLVGLLVGIGSMVVGAPYPVMFGLIAFVLNTIPLLGPLLYGTICLLLTIGAGMPPEVILGIVSVFLLSRLCDDLIFVPTIYGKSHQMHPVLVVCVVLIGASMAGAWGMLLAIPISSILFSGLDIIREISRGEEVAPLPPSVSAPFA